MDIYWDIQNHEFVKELGNSQTVQRFDWYLRDQVPVCLYIVTPDSDDQGYTAQEAPAGFSVKFTAKHSGSLAGTALVFQGTWAKTGSGSDAYYEATIDLNTAELIAAAGTTDPYDIYGEFTLQDANGDHRDSTRIDVRIYQDVLRGTEDTPTSATAPWPYVQWYTDANGYKCCRILNEDGQTLLDLKPPGAPT